MSRSSDLLDDKTAAPPTGLTRFGPIRLARRIVVLGRRLRRDERGVTSIELAMVALPFLALVMGILALGFRFFVGQALEAGLADGARRVMTGQVQGDATITSIADFKNRVLCPTTGTRPLPSFIDCSQLVIDIRTISSFGAAGYATSASTFLSSGGGTFNTGTKGSIVVARVAYPLPAIAAALSGGGTVTYGGKEVYALMATAVFRNEPF